MNKFIVKKPIPDSINKTIRFPREMNNQINQILKKINEGKKLKYSFNEFIISACEYAINNMEEL